jgi:hypothetical protein
MVFDQFQRVRDTGAVAILDVTADVGPYYGPMTEPTRMAMGRFSLSLTLARTAPPTTPPTTAPTASQSQRPVTTP